MAVTYLMCGGCEAVVLAILLGTDGGSYLQTDDGRWILFG